MDEDCGYFQALKAAGAIIHAYKQFGSYQGDWWAKVTLPNKRTGWIHDYYGSCSGCDGFEATFGYVKEHCDEHWSEASGQGCEACEKAKVNYNARLKAFGEAYFDQLLSQDAAEKEAAKEISWDADAAKVLAFIRIMQHE